MRAREFVSEEITKKITKSARYAIRHGRVFPSLDNSNPYDIYRFGLAMAPNPNKELTSTEGPTGSKMVTVSYTDADDHIIDVAAKEFGITSQDFSTPESEEMDTVNKQSPVPHNSGKKRR